MLARPEVAHVTDCQHGGIDYAELAAIGISSDEIVDFSANLNPFGPPPEVMQALSDASHGSDEAICRYPDSQAFHLRRSLAKALGIRVENMVVGNGSTELIRLTALAYFGKGDRVLIVEPTFGEYETACQITGATVIRQRLSKDNDFQPDVEGTVELIKQHRPKGVFVCNPNNPTGRYLSRVAFERILDAGDDLLVVLDEAYVGFVDDAWSSPSLALQSSSASKKRGNLLILRSMTKDYAMAGLRLGYGIAREEIADTLRRVCPPWNVNVLAQRTGIAAIANDTYLSRCRSELKQANSYLVAELSGLGLAPLRSEANFFLVDVGDARKFRRGLLERRILVRDCSSFGLPQYVRIAPRTLTECQMLVASIRELRKRCVNGG
ncbi:MAG: histidinol-phosphate aminotransferase family protein [Dehalococcoidia bacterium]|nr:histidinol-phosphate aminotransferase family protein [Dehalococcoidia bacterium]